MAEGRKTANKTFFSGVLLLSLSTVLVKAVGLLYKIPMLSYLGSVGMGYFNSAYEIYALFCVIATAGLPVALSVLVSAALARKEEGQARRILRLSVVIFLWIGLAGSLIMALFAPAFCRLIKSENAYGCMLAISPTVLIICISSALRGYFQGYQRMLPTAISQLIEAVGKLVFGVLLARAALERGMETPQVAAAAGIGLTLGTLCSLLYLLFELVRFRCAEGKSVSEKAPAAKPEPCGKILLTLAKLAVPMTLGACMVSLTKLVDMTMILRRLQSIGYSEGAANDLYGSYTTLALSVFGLIPSLVNSVALPLLPMLSAAIASEDKVRQEQMILASYRLTAMFAVPAALGVSAFAQPILMLLFGREPQAVEVAAPLLSMLGVSVFLSCMITATNSVLHAYRLVGLPILSMLLGTLAKVVSAYFLIGSPTVGLLGAPISTFLCDALIVGFNLFFAARLCKTEGLMPLFLRPLGAALLSVIPTYLAYRWLSSAFSAGGALTLACLLLTVALYGWFACLLGVVEEQDLLALPMGDRIYGMLCRFGIFSNGKRKKGRTV